MLDLRLQFKDGTSEKFKARVCSEATVCGVPCLVVLMEDGAKLSIPVENLFWWSTLEDAASSVPA